MPNASPTAWDFPDAFPSPDNFYKLVYYDLGEIGMGGPLAGTGYLESNDNQKFRIPNRCGGPPIWETAGKLLAVPLWIYDDRKGLLHRLGVVNAISKELTIFSRVGNLDFYSFEKTVINGDRRSSLIDLQKEKVDKVVGLESVISDQ